MRISKANRMMLIGMLLLFTAACNKQPAANDPVNPAPSINKPSASTDATDNTPTTAQPYLPGSSAPTNADQAKPKMDAASVAFISDTAGWIGGKGFIYQTIDGGRHWEKRYSGTENIGAFTFLKSNPMIGWAYEGTVNGSNSSGNPKSKQTLLQTIDGGVTWNVVASSVSLGKEVHFVSEREGFSGNKATYDGGKTWNERPVPPELSGEAYFTTAKDGWSVTNNGSSYQIEHTTDGGTTWTPVYEHTVGSILNGAVIRSGGSNDVWVHLIGDSGMTQTSHTLLHSKDAGKTWTAVVAHSTAGGGPAPGYSPGVETGPAGPGTNPVQLAVVSPQTAVMLGGCPACGDTGMLSVGWTQDGGTAWTNSSQQIPGPNGMLTFVNDQQGWLLTRTISRPSVLYSTSDGGKQWTKVYSFE